VAVLLQLQISLSRLCDTLLPAYNHTTKGEQMDLQTFGHLSFPKYLTTAEGSAVTLCDAQGVARVTVKAGDEATALIRLLQAANRHALKSSAAPTTKMIHSRTVKIDAAAKVAKPATPKVAKSTKRATKSKGSPTA